VRGYIALGVSENEHGGDVAASNNFSANRAFIQWAGFTFGRAQSFFDFYSNPATSYWGAFPGSDTGDGGWFLMATLPSSATASRRQSPPKHRAKPKLR
jgi:hypothetical protein